MDRTPMPHTMVIFGASGDLTSRKLIPALYRQFQRGRLPKPTRIVGVSRSPFSSEDWRNQLTETTAKYVKGEFDNDSWKAFSNEIYYHPGDIGNEEDFQKLSAFLTEIEKSQTTDRTYYLSTMPQLYASAVEQLGRAGLNIDTHGHRRVVIEKPFGTDLASAQALNASIHQTFREDQIYRIDHYLGKETVQNILVLRFGNTIFEPLWNRNYVDHVQITVAEEVTVGRRGDYYDKSGVLRDMFQNHIFQLMMVTAMEAPVRYTGEFVRDEKVKVLQAVRPYRGSDFSEFGIRGQYAGYAQEEGVPEGSQTETFAALKLYIDNWRWRGVPFYLRSGKGMSCRSSQIVTPRSQSAGNPNPTRRRRTAILPVQSTRLGHATPAQRTRFSFRFQRERIAGCLPAIAARCHGGRSWAFRAQRRSRTGMADHRSDHLRLEEPRCTNVIHLRSRRLGTDTMQRMDGATR